MTLSTCNCPAHVRVHDVVGTKPPCPVHDTPERLAALAKIIVPRVEQPVTEYSRVTLPARKARRS